MTSWSSAYHAISIDCYTSKPRGRYQPLLACMNGTAKRDKDQEWGTSGDSGWATSIRKCYQCANAVFHRRRQDGLTTLTKRPFTELLLQCLEVVAKLGPPYQYHQKQLLCRYLAGSSSSIILCHWKSGRFHTGRKR